MSDVLESTEPGWRPDPSGRYEWRYWDNGWTNRVANSVRGKAPTPPQPEVPAPPASVVTPAAVVTPAPEVAPAPAPAPEVDPFAVLRIPRRPEPAFEEGAPEPAPQPVAAPELVAPAVAEVIPTHATRHDGSSGTAWDAPYTMPGTTPDDAPDERRAVTRGFAGVLGFVRSFWEQPESYHSPKAGIELQAHPHSSQLEQPANYARAGLVMLAACGVAVGAYLPWISGTVGLAAFERTGYDMGRAWGFTWVAAAFVVAAMLATRRRVMGWVTMGMAVLVAGLVARQLLLVHDQVQGLNTGQAVDANVGVGLWIMLASAAIGLVAAFRFDGTEQIV